MERKLINVLFQWIGFVLLMGSLLIIFLTLGYVGFDWFSNVDFIHMEFFYYWAGLFPIWFFMMIYGELNMMIKEEEKQDE